MRRKFSTVLKHRVSVFLLASLLVSPLIAQSLVQLLLSNPVTVPEYVSKYLKPGEQVVDIKKLKFYDNPEYNMTVYKLSSGKVIIYSEKVGAVVLGDEWVGLQGADELALQLYTAYYFSSVKKLEYNKLVEGLSFSWYTGVKIYDEYAKKRLLQIAALSALAGTLLIILFPPSSLLAFTIFAVSYTYNTASMLQSFVETLNLNPSNSPYVFLALALAKSQNENSLDSLRQTFKSLEKIDKDLAQKLETIAINSQLITGVHDVIGKSLLVSSLLAAKSGYLDEVISIVGEDGYVMLLEKFVADDAAAARNFIKNLETWARASSAAAKLRAIEGVKGTISGVLLQTIVSEALWYLVRYGAVEAFKDEDQLMGFFGVHCLVLGDLANDLNNFAVNIVKENYAPTLSNLMTFYRNKQIYHLIELELHNAISEVDIEKLRSTGILDYYGGADNWYSVVESKKSSATKMYEQSLSEGLVLAKDALQAFESFRDDMAGRRRAPGPSAGLDIVLVVDTSGSMGDGFGGERKIDAAVKAGKHFVRLTQPFDSVGLVTFASTAKVVVDLTSDKERALSALDTLAPGGNTALGDGLWLALDMLEARAEKRPAAVILLTDGKHNAGQRTPEESARRAKDIGVPVYTLGFGEKGDIDETTLKNVASLTGGDYTYAPSPEDLRKIYARLSSLISGHYVIQSLTGVLKQGEEFELAVPVEAGQSYFTVRVSYSGSLLELEAITPSGRVHDLRSGNTIYYREKGLEQLTVYFPSQGEWKVKVKAVEAPSGGVEFAAAVSKPGFTASMADSELVVAPGAGASTRVIVRALRDLPSISVVIPQHLKSILTVEPVEARNVKEGSVVEFTVNVKAVAGDVSDAIALQSLDSVVFLPIRVKVKNRLTLALASSSLEVYEGRPVTIGFLLLDERGNPISSAQVKLKVKNIQFSLTETVKGLYQANVTGLGAGRYLLEATAEKSGYFGATSALSLRILMLGDANKDDWVDYRDLAIVVARYGYGVTDADLNQDGKVDYKDIAIVISNYGRKP